MERFEGHPNFFHLEQGFVDTERLKLEEEVNNNMPFLEMLQSVEFPQRFPSKEPNFHTFMRLQNLKNPWEGLGIANTPTLEIDSCVTHEMLQMQSPLKFESNEFQHQELPKTGEVVTRELRRKRKRTRKVKNKEDVENQRMTHIAVERNRRRQMNDHLCVLKSLMPPSYSQRGDHASIIGGAIIFVKELEQLLHFLEAQNKMRENKDVGSTALLEPCHGRISCSSTEVYCEGEIKAERKSEAVSIEVTVIHQNHVNLKIQCQRRVGQLVKAIVALEELRQTIMHLNIKSLEASSVLYSFNLKIEEDSKIVRASEIAETVDHIFRFTNGR